MRRRSSDEGDACEMAMSLFGTAFLCIQLMPFNSPKSEETEGPVNSDDVLDPFEDRLDFNLLGFRIFGGTHQRVLFPRHVA